MSNIKDIYCKTVGELCITTVVFYDNIYVDILTYIKTLHSITVDVNLHAAIHTDNHRKKAVCDIATKIYHHIHKTYIAGPILHETPHIDELSAEVHHIVRNINTNRLY